MKTFKIMVTREVTCLDVTTVTIEAKNIGEAVRGAMADAEEGYIDEWILDEFPQVKYFAEEDSDE